MIPAEATFCKTAWVRMKHLLTGVGIFGSLKYSWGIRSTAACECSAEELSAKHILTHVPYTLHFELLAWEIIDEDTIKRLLEVCLDIDHQLLYLVTFL